MKLFPRAYARQLYRVQGPTLAKVLEILTPWIDLAICPDSPILEEIASQLLRKLGSTTAPRLLKKMATAEMLRSNDMEDLRASLALSIVESFAEFQPGKGSNLPTWLSWRIPYHCSKLITWALPAGVASEEAGDDPSLREIDEMNWQRDLAAIICEEVGVSRQLKYHYTRGNNESDESSR